MVNSFEIQNSISLCKQKCALSFNDSLSFLTRTSHIARTPFLPKNTLSSHGSHVDVCVNFSRKIDERKGGREEIRNFLVSHISLDGCAVVFWQWTLVKVDVNLSIHSSNLLCRSIISFSCFHFVRFTFFQFHLFFPFGMFAQTHARTSTLNNCYSHTQTLFVILLCKSNLFRLS